MRTVLSDERAAAAAAMATARVEVVAVMTSWLDSAFLADTQCVLRVQNRCSVRVARAKAHLV